MDSILTQAYPVVINYEPRFQVLYSGLEGLSGVRKKKHQIICPIILNNTINDPLLAAVDDVSLQKVQSEENPFIFIKENVYARNQQIVFLIAKTEQEFISKLNTRTEDLLHILEKQAVQTAYRKEVSPNGSKFQFQNKKRNISYTIPTGYELEMQGDQFIWYRKAEMGLSLNVIIAWADLKDFLEHRSMVSWRDSLSRKCKS